MSEQRDFRIGDRVKATKEAASYGLVGTVNAVGYQGRRNIISVIPDKPTIWVGMGLDGGYTIPAERLEFESWGGTLEATKSTLSQVRHSGRLT